MLAPDTNTAPATPIGELVGRDDFPQCALDRLVDIGGVAGIVVDIIGQSLKVKSPDGTITSFNSRVLRRLYARPKRQPEPVTPEREPEAVPPDSTPPDSTPSDSLSIAPASTESPSSPTSSAGEAPEVIAPTPAPPAGGDAFAKPAKPIGEFAGREDYPQCTLGEHLDIGGFTGVAVEVVHNSVKVRSAEGVVRGFNYHVLRKLYGPRVEIEPMPSRADEPTPTFTPTKPATAAPMEVPREQQEIEAADFTQEVRAISVYAGQSDFPQCTYGKLVYIAGYTGVVVSIEGGSLKVRSEEGTSRKYNPDVLRKLYGKK